MNAIQQGSVAIEILRAIANDQVRFHISQQGMLMCTDACGHQESIVLSGIINKDQIAEFAAIYPEIINKAPVEHSAELPFEQNGEKSLCDMADAAAAASRS